MNHTTLEQSKKLIELGLDPSSADLWYAERYEGKHTPEGMYYTEKEPYTYYLSLTKPSEGNCSIDYIKDIPCWSIGALIELIPESINDNTPCYAELEFSKRSIAYHNIDDPIKIGYLRDTLFEACYCMVCWLLENNYIKKG